MKTRYEQALIDSGLFTKRSQWNIKDYSFFSNPKADRYWIEFELLKIPQWHGINDYLLIYERSII